MSSPRPRDPTPEANLDTSPDEEPTLESQKKFRGWAYLQYAVLKNDEEKLTIRLKQVEKKETEYEHFARLENNAKTNAENNVEEEKGRKTRTSRKNTRYIANFLAFEESESELEDSEPSQKKASPTKKRKRSESPHLQMENSLLTLVETPSTQSNVAVTIDSAPPPAADLTPATVPVTPAPVSVITIDIASSASSSISTITNPNVETNITTSTSLSTKPVQTNVANVLSIPGNMEKFIQLQHLNWQWSSLYLPYKMLAQDNPQTLWVLDYFNSYINSSVNFLTIPYLSPPQIFSGTTTPSLPITSVSPPLSLNVVTNTPNPIIVSLQPSPVTASQTPAAHTPTPTPVPAPVVDTPPPILPVLSAPIPTTTTSVAPTKAENIKTQPVASTSRLFSVHATRPIESVSFAAENNNQDEDSDSDRTDFINELLLENNRPRSPS